jgi:hypothetical protein
MRVLLRNLLLLLQILVVMSLAAAFSEPSVNLPAAAASGPTVLLLDASASMKAGSGGTTRFELARARAMELVRGAGSRERIMVVRAAAEPRVEVAFTAQRGRLLDAIRAVEPTEEPLALTEALATAVTLAAGDPDGRVVFFTDGAVDVPPALPAGTLELSLVGEPVDNMAVTGFRFRREPGSASSYQVLVSVRNFSSAARLNRVELSVDGQVVGSQLVNVAAGKEQQMFFRWSGSFFSSAVAALEVGDEFPLDDRAFAVLSEAPEVRVLLVSPGDFFLESLLGLLPHLKVVVAPAYYEGDFDLVLFDRVAPEGQLPNRSVLMAVGSPTDDRLAPVVTGWDQSHPVMQGVDPSGLTILRSALPEPPPRARTLISSDQGPLAYTVDGSEGRHIFLGFHPASSDLPLRAAFPVLMINALNWLYEGQIGAHVREVQSGEPITIAVDSDEAAVRRPDGSLDIVPVPAGRLVYRRTDLVGLYTVERPEAGRFAVNLRSDMESDLSPRLGVESGEAESAGPSGSRLVLLQRLLIGLGLVLLTVEWFVQVRRW